MISLTTVGEPPRDRSSLITTQSNTSMSRSRGILSDDGGTTISQGAKAEDLSRAVSQSAVNYLRCVSGVLPSGVLRGWDAAVVLFCVVDALNTLGKVPAVHITICNNTTGARD